MNIALRTELRACRLEEGRPGAIWQEMFGRSELHGALCAGLGLRFPCPGGHPDSAALMSLWEIGIAVAKISICGTLWRECCGDEDGVIAAILPVGRGGERSQAGWVVPGIERCLSMMGGHEHCAFDGAPRVADLIAMPLDGGRALSLTGMTAAVGDFGAQNDGTLTVAASGLSWLKRHAARAREAAKETPAQLVSRHLPFPHSVETLVLDPAAFEWRADSMDCVVRHGVERIASPDSAGLARFIDAAMRMRLRPAKIPEMLAPRMPA